jgi:hypothetical protein
MDCLRFGSRATRQLDLHARRKEALDPGDTPFLVRSGRGLFQACNGKRTHISAKLQKLFSIAIGKLLALLRTGECSPAGGGQKSTALGQVPLWPHSQSFFVGRPRNFLA